MMHARSIHLSLPLALALALASGCSCSDDDPIVTPDISVIDATDDDGSDGDTDGSDADTEPSEGVGPGDDGDDVPPTGCTVAADCKELALGPCEVPQCDDGRCVVGTEGDGVTCDDGDKCSLTSTCVEGTCTAKTFKNCIGEVDGPCRANVRCEAGDCKFDFATANTPCDDDNACTSGEVCSGGPTGCTGGESVCTEICGNGIDDDLNQATDCDDSECVADPSCIGACSFVQTLQCGDEVTVNPTDDPPTVQSTDYIDAWPCTNMSAPSDGPEVAWSVIATLGTKVTVSLSAAPDSARVHHLVDTGVTATCNKSQCVEEALSFTYTAPPAGERHHAVVDMQAEDAGPFTLKVDCEVCAPSCDGKQCGSDGCGGTCGSCTGGQSCSGGTCVAAPPNSTCLTAQPLPSTNLPFITTGTTAAGGNDLDLDPGNTCPGAGGLGIGLAGADVVYSFTPAAAGDYLFAIDAAFPATVYVVEDCTNPTATCVGAAGDTSPDGEQLVVALKLGVKYSVVIDTFSGTTSGPFTLTINKWPCSAVCDNKECGVDGCGGSCGTCTGGKVCGGSGQCVAAAGNDTCASAASIAAVPYSASGSTGNANHDFFVPPDFCPGAPSGDGTGGNDLVWKFTAPQNGKFRATLTPNGFDGLLSVLGSCSLSALDCLGASDVTGTTAEEVEFALAAGEAAWIVVDGATAGQSGAFELDLVSVDCTSSCVGKQCGSDGCGGSCGSCDPGETCSLSGQCLAPLLYDDCSAPGEITALPYQYAGGTELAKNDYTLSPEDGCDAGPTSAVYGKGPDLVFVYTSPIAQDVFFS
ncbi:MAG: hypothetical protein IV100_02670, partial [Myxococcales bacterium]|nr:hypothetical protein [Myxococcales bacterium]